jgi:predicted RNA methylase
MARRLLNVGAPMADFSASDAHAHERPTWPTDAAFDRMLPFREQRAAACFWTPVAVAHRAAALFREYGSTRVLDVGAGPGKLCITAAASHPEIHWKGVEQRRRLVHVGQTLIERLRLENAEMVHADAFKIEWSEFDGFYFFNPFGENLYRGEHAVFDSTVELSEARFMTDVRSAEQLLARAKLGTVLVTYHGFGGRIAGTFSPMHRERAGTDWLRVWVRTEAEIEHDETWLEMPDGTATLGKWYTARSALGRD